MARARLSACLIVKDESDQLPRCLRSLAPVADQVVVVDTGSRDGTVEVARAHGARVAVVPWRGDFSAARNAALGLASGDWILVLDADEELDDSTLPQLRQALSAPGAEAYWCRVVSYLGETPDDGNVVENQSVRLFRNRRAYRFRGRIHEQILPALAEAGAQPQASPVTILHYGYLSSVVALKQKIARNAALLEEETARHPEDAFSWFNLGTEHLRAQRLAEAEEAFRRSLLLTGPEKPRYLSVAVRNLVLTLRAQGKHAEVLEVLRQYQSVFPDYTDLVYLEGLTHADLLDWESVEGAMRRALELGDAPSEHYLVLHGAGGELARLWLGIAEAERGRGSSALRSIAAAADALPHDPLALEHLARLALRLEGPAGALARLLPVARRGTQAARRVARALAKAGAYAEALTALRAGDDSEDPQVAVFVGECLFRLGRISEAIETFLGVPEGHPARLPALLDAVVASLVAGDDRAAGEYLARAQALEPRGVDVLFRAFRAVLEVVRGTGGRIDVPDDERPVALALVRNLVRAALSQGQTRLASRLSLLLRLLGLSDGEALCLMGKLAYLSGCGDLAGQYLSRAYAQGGLDAEGCAIAADLHYQAGHLEDAVVLYRAFVETASRGALATYLQAASAALRLHRLGEALHFLQCGLVHYPQASLLRDARERIQALGSARPA